MSILVPVRRPQTRWKQVIPVYDGRECPDCGAVCLGPKMQSRHERWHVDQLHWQERLIKSLAGVFRKAGLGVVFERAGNDDDDEEIGEDGYVSLVTKNDDGEEDDEYAG